MALAFNVSSKIGGVQRPSNAAAARAPIATARCAAAAAPLPQAQRRRSVAAPAAAKDPTTERARALAELEGFAATNAANLAAAAQRMRKAGTAAAAASGAPATTADAPADAAGAAAAGELLELTQQNFWNFLDDRKGKLTVVDFFTQWCGPCKVIYPELVKMNAEFAANNVDVVIVKVECAAKNKDLGKELGVRVAPTFHVYKGKDKVGEMTGAKADQLRALIQQNLPQA